MPMKRPGSMAISAMKRKAGEAASACTPTKRALRNRPSSSSGLAMRRSTRTKATASTADASSEPSTPGLRQPVSGASSMPQVNRPSAPVKQSAPRQSSRPRMPAGVARTLAATMAAPSRPTRPVARNTHCHPAASTSQPEASGPKDRPMPKVVPSRLKARARAAPWNSGASEDMAAAKAAAPPVPWTSRSTSIQKTDGASGSRKVAAQNSARPSSQTRRGPIRSTRLPATMITLP